MTESTTPNAPLSLPAPNDMTDLLTRARAGDATTLPVLRTLLQSPEAITMLGGNLVQMAQDGILTALGGSDLAMKEAVRKRLDNLRRGVLSEGASQMEQILAGRVVSAWLQLQHAELMYARKLTTATITQSEFHQRRIDACNRRLLMAVKTLVQVRKTGVPVVRLSTALAATSPLDQLPREIAAPESDERGTAESVTE